MAILYATRTTLDDDDDDVDCTFVVVVVVGTDQFIVYNQSKYCSFGPGCRGAHPGAARACLQECLNGLVGPQQMYFLVDLGLVGPQQMYYLVDLGLVGPQQMYFLLDIGLVGPQQR